MTKYHIINHHSITVILLKVALNTITITQIIIIQNYGQQAYSYNDRMLYKKHTKNTL